MLTTEPFQVNTRYRQLDSLRGIAALFVFLSHYFMIFKISGSWVLPLQASPLGILINGRSAVLFFFVLSGFVLSLPFLNNDRPLNLWGFYLKRVFRLYPAYLLAILFAVLLKTFFYDQKGMANYTEWIGHFWTWNWNRQNYIEIVKTFLLVWPNFNADLIDPVIWSLAVEMKMSLLLPFFILIVSRSNLFFNLLFFLIVEMMIYHHQLGYLEVFYLGILTAKYKDHLVAKIRLWSVPSVIAISIFSLLLYNINFEFFKQYKNLTSFDFFWRDSLSAAGSGILVIVAIGRKRIANLLERKFFLFSGDISYTFYLIHLPVLITLCSVFPSGNSIAFISIFLLTVIIAFMLSYTNFKFIEVPFQRYAKNIIARYKFLKSSKFNL